jgi:hypothetical protein
MKKINNKTIGNVYIIAGFLIIITNVLQYYFSYNSTLFTTITIGLALIAVGLFYFKKKQ